MSYVLAIAIPAAVLICGCVAITRDRLRDDDPAPFNWEGTVPAAPGQCSCGAPHARKLTPFPPGAAPALPEMIAAPVAAPAAVTRPSYVTDEIGDRDAGAWVESAWNRIQVRELNEKLREDAS